jgi:hypothetical protein
LAFTFLGFLFGGAVLARQMEKLEPESKLKLRPVMLAFVAAGSVIGVGLVLNVVLLLTSRGA